MLRSDEERQILAHELLLVQRVSEQQHRAAAELHHAVGNQHESQHEIAQAADAASEVGSCRASSALREDSRCPSVSHGPAKGMASQPPTGGGTNVSLGGS